MGGRARVDARSGELFSRAVELLPGGVNSPVRAMQAIGRDPIFVERGEGAELVDVDGNRYVDWVMSWGPLVFGHADPETVDPRFAQDTCDQRGRLDRGRPTRELKLLVSCIREPNEQERRASSAVSMSIPLASGLL